MASCAWNSKCRVLQARFGGLTGVRPAAHPASLPHFLAASFAPSRRAAYSSSVARFRSPAFGLGTCNVRRAVAGRLGNELDPGFQR